MTVLILAVSSALFVYWFRYTVILILRTRTAPEYAHQVAQANRLSFVAVREKLLSPELGNLSGLCSALKKDYKILRYLLGHAATGPAGRYTAEQRLLMANFQLTAMYFLALFRFRPQAARAALLEMSTTLEYFADVMGRRIAVDTAASA